MSAQNFVQRNPKPLFPQPPHGYRGRNAQEEDIIERLHEQKLVVITNQDNELCTTGKSALVASICSNPHVSDYFSDGILWLTLSRFIVPLNARSYGSFLHFLFEEIRRDICPDLSATSFTHQPQSHSCTKEEKDASGVKDSSIHFWEAAIYKLLAILGPQSKYLLILDNMPDSSVIQTLVTLGMSIIVTIRASAFTAENNVSVTAILDVDTRRSIFDIEGIDVLAGHGAASSREDEGSGHGPALSQPAPLPSFVCSLSTLLQSAYKLGYGDNAEHRKEVCQHVPAGSLTTKLLCHFSTLSADTKDKFLLLSCLPAGVFLPVSLVYCLWSSASVQGQTASKLSQKEDIRYLYQLSLIQLSVNHDMVLLTSETKKFMSAIFDQGASLSPSVHVPVSSGVPSCREASMGRLCALSEDALEILEYVLSNDKLDFISCQFNLPVYSSALWCCFTSLNWTEAEVIEKYTSMFEKEIESSQFSSKNYTSQITTLTDIEEVIRTLFTSKEMMNTQDVFLATSHTYDEEPRALTDVSSSTSSSNFSSWCLQWNQKIVAYKEALYDLYHDNEVPPVCFCATLSLLADLSSSCGHHREAISIRKRIISIQREYLPADDLDLGKSLYGLACAQYLLCLEHQSVANDTSSFNSDAPSPEAVSIQEVESMCCLALRCFQEYEQSFVVITLTDLSMSLLVKILNIQEEKSAAIIELLQEMLSSRKKFYCDVYHVQVAETYYQLANVHYSMGSVNVAIKLMNKNIRIMRHIYGDCHLNTARMLECLAHYFALDHNYARAETLFSKSIGIQQILCQHDPLVQTSLALSRSALATLTARRLAAEHEQQQIEDIHQDPNSTFVDESKSSLNKTKPSGEAKEKRIVGHSREDAILLVALADRIFKKEANYGKAKKYIYKALKILSLCSNNSNAEGQFTTESVADDSNISIIKWSAYNKLADICVCEDNVQEAAKLYQRALRGFLTINLTVTPALREQKGEAIVIAVHLATLVDTAMGFPEAVTLYRKVVDIIAQLNTIISDLEHGVNSPTEPTYSSVEHAVTLVSIADRFKEEANASGCNTGISMMSQSSDDSRHTSDTTPPEDGIGDSDGSRDRFLLRVWTLALAVFNFHLGSEDEHTLRCQDQLDRLIGDDSAWTGAGGGASALALAQHSGSWAGTTSSAEDGKDRTSVTLSSSASRSASAARVVASIPDPSLLGNDLSPPPPHPPPGGQQGAETAPPPPFTPTNSLAVLLPEDMGVLQEDTSLSLERQKQPVPPLSSSTECPDDGNDSDSGGGSGSDDNVNVFAFGCCRRNQLHSNLLNSYQSHHCSYLGTTSSTQKYFMFVNKHDGKPFITTQSLPSEYAGVSKGVSCVIVGEVYSIPKTLLSSMCEDICEEVKFSIEALPIKPLHSSASSGEADSGSGSGSGTRSCSNNIMQAFFHVVTDVTDLSERFIANCRNIPRGNYTEFIRARGGIETFIDNSKSTLK